jgi:hypothetical protein
MSYREHRSWPPIWIPYGGFWEKHRAILQGEVGVLAKVRYYPQRRGRIYLRIDRDGVEYIGCVLLDDEVFCEHVVEHLERFCGTPIEAIGSSEIGVPLELR